jgi:hypothetical protein
MSLPLHDGDRNRDKEGEITGKQSLMKVCLSPPKEDRLFVVMGLIDLFSKKLSNRLDIISQSVILLTSTTTQEVHYEHRTIAYL